MIRALALLGAAVAGAYGVTAGLIEPGAILDLPTALLAFAGGSIFVLAALRCM